MWLFAALLVIGGFVPFVNAFDLPFIMDDQSSIVDNPTIRRLWPLATTLNGPWQTATAGRPVVNLSFAINYALGATDPAGYHAANLAIHLAAGLALFGVVRRTLRAPRLRDRFGVAADRLACAVALVWLVHPLQTEVIDYVTQRTETLAGLFYLLTLYASIRAMSSDRRPFAWEAAAVASCALGMATKESMVTAPVMVLVYDAAFFGGSFAGAIRSRARLYAGLALTWALLAALIAPGPRSRSAGFSFGVSWWTYLLNQPALIVRYLRLSVWPVGLVADYGRPVNVGWLQAMPYAAFLVALAGAAIALWRARPEVAFLGVWFFVTLAPSSSIVPIDTEVGAERRVYLGLAAVVTAIVAGAWRLLIPAAVRYLPRWKSVLAPLSVAVVVAMLTALTLARNAEYKSGERIWLTVLERYPHGRAHHNLAFELKKQGRRSEALEHYRLALADAPEAHYALGFELEADGKHEEAIAHFREFVRLRPDELNVPRAYVLMGHALQALGRLDEAAEAFSETVRMWPRDVDGRAGLAGVRLAQGRYDDAAARFQEVIALDAANASAYANLGIALAGLNREQEAVPAFARAVELDPGDPSLRRNLGNALAATGRLEEAAAQYARVLAVSPNDAVLRQDLGLVLVGLRKYREAEAEFRRALEIDPSNAEARTALAALAARTEPAARN
jgi:tetratricopeptide (TPR) repeat protein